MKEKQKIQRLCFFLALLYTLLFCLALFSNLLLRLAYTSTNTLFASLFSASFDQYPKALDTLISQGYTPLALFAAFCISFFQLPNLLLYFFGFFLCLLPCFLYETFLDKKQKELGALLESLYSQKAYSNPQEKELTAIFRYVQAQKDNSLKEQTALIEAYVQRQEKSENLIHQLQIDLSSVILQLDMLQESTLENVCDPTIAQLEQISQAMKLYLKESKEISFLKYLHFTYVDLKELLMQTKKQFETSLQNKQLTIDLSVENMPVFADSYWIKEVFKTLLSNAIEYAPENSWISIWNENEPDKVEIFIANEAALSGKLLEESMFRRFASSSSNNHFGIGLHMANSIVKEHFGRLYLTNDAHQTCFHIVLPVNVLERAGLEKEKS
jgi:signal transduction histidine kinase